MTNAPTLRRRPLRFDRLNEIAPDAQALLRGHRLVGTWSLGQIGRHLAASFHGSMDGFDLSRHRVKRTLFSRLLLRYTFRWGIPEQYRVDSSIEPRGEVADADGVGELCDAIERYDRCRGPLHAHPLFGLMSRSEWDRVHRIHSAHHLSFALSDPQPPSDPERDGVNPPLA